MTGRPRFLLLVVVFATFAGGFTWFATGQIIGNTDANERQDKTDRRLATTDAKLERAISDLRQLQRRSAACVPGNDGKPKNPELCRRLLDQAIAALSRSQQGRLGRGGADGPAGRDGQPGQPGAAGQAGPAGSNGPAGPAGPAGPRGHRGPQGPPGERGPAGPPGRTPTPDEIRRAVCEMPPFAPLCAVAPR